MAKRGNHPSAGIRQPVPTISRVESRRQKPKNDDQPCTITNLPTNESNASSLQVPLDPAAAVPTRRTYDQGEK